MESQDGNSRKSGRTKIVAREGDPVVAVADVTDVVQVGFELRTVEPHVAHPLIAVERDVSNTIHATTP